MCDVSMIQVLELESLFVSPECCREDLAGLLRSVQTQEKEKLQLVCLPFLILYYGTKSMLRQLVGFVLISPGN